MGFLQPIHITFFIYILAMLGIGFYAYHSTKNLSDYILGGRSLGSVVTALSAGASDMSGWLLMGLPGAIFIAGISESWIAIGLLLGAYLNWLFVAGRLRLFTEKANDALTLPDYFHGRFEDKQKLLKIFSALIILFFFIIYCASGVVASARLFESTFNMDYDIALWVGAFATIAYVFIGGFLAVSWTDTVQATLMIFALLLVPTIVILKMGDYGSLDVMNTIEVIRNASPDHLNFTHGLTWIAIVSLLAWGLGYCGQPHILVRFMAADSIKTIPSARRISITWMALCLLGAVLVGFFGYGYFLEHPEQGINVIGGMTSTGEVIKGNPESVFMELAKVLLNPWIAGIVLSGVLAAVMSTLSCQLLVSSSALTEDLYKGFFRPKASDKELVWIGRLMVFIVAIISIWIAYDPDSKVLSLVSYAWAGFGAAFGPVVVFSIFWKRTSRNGALLGMITGALTVIIFPKIKVWLAASQGVDVSVIAEQYPLLTLYEILPGFLLASMVLVIVSLFSKASSSMEKNFTDAHSEYKSLMKAKS